MRWRDDGPEMILEERYLAPSVAVAPTRTRLLRSARLATFSPDGSGCVSFKMQSAKYKSSGAN